MAEISVTPEKLLTDLEAAHKLSSGASSAGAEHDTNISSLESDVPQPTVVFRKRGTRNARNRPLSPSETSASSEVATDLTEVIEKVLSNDASVDDDSSSTLHNIMQLQQRRQQKLRGIVMSTDAEEEAQLRFFDREKSNQQRKLKHKTPVAGLVSNAELGSLARNMQSAGNEVDIGTEFSLEQNFGDVEAEMRTFVEQELKKRKGEMEEVADQATKRPKLQTPEDALLLVAQKYERFRSRRNEDMISDQMLTGIPEVELGVEAKMRNIESTDKAKKELLRRIREARSAGREYDNEIPSELVPANMAVNYVQHARYDIQQPWWQKNAAGTSDKGAADARPSGAAVAGGESNAGDSSAGNSGSTRIGGHATDDIHFDKFRKQLRDRFMSKSSRGGRRRGRGH